MKILFFYIDSQTSSGFTTGLGIASMSGYLKKFGHETSLVYYKTKADIEYALNKIQMFSPDLIGFYSTAVGASTVHDLSEQIRQQYPELFQIYGGVHATLTPETIYEIKTLDALCVGYGEVPLLRYTEAIATNSRRYDIPGLWIRPSLQDTHEIIKNSAYFPDGDPDEFLDFDYEIFQSEFSRFPDCEVNRVEIMFNRGCPFRCSFCSNHRLNETYENKRFMPSAEKSIISLQNALAQTGFKAISIHDDIFTLRKEWFRAFITSYAEKVGLPFVCSLRAGTFGEEEVKLLKAANVEGVWIGVESGNDFIRNDVMQKGTSKELLLEACALLHKYKIRIFTQNIIGVPHETPKHFIDTILLNARLDPALSFLSVFYPYPNTALHAICKEEGLIGETSKNFIERESTILNMPSFPPKEINYYFTNYQRLLEYQKRRNGHSRLHFIPLKSYSSRLILSYMSLLHFLTRVARKLRHLTNPLLKSVSSKS